jgi:hypothetical protein
MIVVRPTYYTENLLRWVCQATDPRLQILFRLFFAADIPHPG